MTSEIKGRVIWVSSQFEPGATIDANEVFIKIDPRVYELEVEEATYELAAHEIELEKQKSIGADIDRLEALRNQARVRLDLARLQLAKTELSLPYSFRVISSSVEIGELAGTAETTGTASILGVAYRPDSIRVDVPIEMQDIQTMDPIKGRPVNIKTTTKEMSGVVTSMGSIVAPKSRLATVYIKFDSELNPSEYPLPNTFVEVEIIGPTEQNVFLLPERSEKSLGQVWLVRNGQLESFEPQILARNNGMLVVKAFDTGDGIAIDIPANMHDGMAVTAVPVGS
ncbi:MAG: HlyD family efflux transporter periplasmic adaptor subunit [Rhodobacteraceae bacterium]|nr:HlyD family efflux transporter periplasmic adaptor subunit [Paracoccaceae bacterium]